MFEQNSAHITESLQQFFSASPCCGSVAKIPPCSSLACRKFTPKSSMSSNKDLQGGKLLMALLNKWVKKKRKAVMWGLYLPDQDLLQLKASLTAQSQHFLAYSLHNFGQLLFLQHPSAFNKKLVIWNMT